MENKEERKVVFKNKIRIQEINIKLYRAKKYNSLKEQSKYLMPAVIKLNKYKKELSSIDQRKLFDL